MKAFLFALVTAIAGILVLIGVIPPIAQFINYAQAANTGNPVLTLILGSFVMLIVVLMFANVFKVYQAYRDN